MTSARKIEANRRNAQRSTGPRTAAGKAKSAQNARRHGLNLPAMCDPAWSAQIKTFAREIAGEDASPRRYELACRIAEAQIDVVRARQARLDLWPDALVKPDGIKRLTATGFYEGRAMSRRNLAIRNFDAFFEPDSGENEPNPRI